jgi:hypothetical protein
MTGQAMSGADVIRNMLQSNLANTGAQSGGGGFNWSQYGTSLYEDDALRALKVAPENDPDSMAYYIERVASAMQQYMYQIFHRAGPLFEEYKKAKESFRLNDAGQIDETCNAFIDDVNKQHDFTRIVAIYGAPFFGKGLIELLRNGNRDQLSQQEYLNCTYTSARNILFLEMVNWLTKAPTGKQYSLRLSHRLQMRIANLENFKEATNSCYELFNQTSPYVNLEFKRPQSTRPDLAMLYGPASEYVHQPFEVNSNNHSNQPPVTDQFRDIMEMVERNASRRQYTPHQPTRNANSYGGETMNDWNHVRNDFNKLTPYNRNEFDLKRFFHPIGKPNTYVIPESDWKKIQHAFKRHEEMGQEETVLPGCFRIVIIDLEADSGWFSTIVRAEGLDMQTVLTDPKKLLPILEDPTLDDTWVVKPVAVEEVTGGKGLDIEIEKVHKLEKALTVIAVKEHIASNSSSELDATLVSVNNRLTEKFTKENAVGFHAVPWDTYVCANPEEKAELYKELPFLFKDYDGEKISYMNACAALGRYQISSNVSDELVGFINNRLTSLVNDFLVNCCGYDGIKSPRHLSISNAIDDHRELFAYLKEKDPVAAAYLVEVEKPNYLTSQVQMFDFKHPHRQTDEESEIEKVKSSVELVVSRPMYINAMNKRGGPAHLENNVPVVIKRSRFPEYFKMIEDGFDQTMGDTHHPDTTDKLIRFNESGSLWLFSYSVVDRNVATLRYVSRHKHLCLMPLS